MVKQRSGVVLMFGGSGPQTLHGLGGFKIALDAMEGQRRQWALELGKDGIRVVTMVTGGIVETIPWQAEGREEIVEEITRTAHLNRTATLEDVGNVAVFIASDRAGAITDATVNISCGAIVDY
jgi:enoyl-[acyl-carrier-protein] reductase (NADH)